MLVRLEDSFIRFGRSSLFSEHFLDFLDSPLRTRNSRQIGPPLQLNKAVPRSTSTYMDTSNLVWGGSFKKVKIKSNNNNIHKSIISRLNFGATVAP